MRFTGITILLLLGLSLFSQDTLTVMQYNLLYYGEITSFCNNSNNSLEMKDPHLQLILDEVQPDIFTVNELSKNHVIHDHLLGKVQEVMPSKQFQRAASSNLSNSNIVNMLYYNSNKLKLKAQYTAQTYIRDIDVYELYYKSDDLADGDTAFLVCVVGHLKAGNSSSEENTRKIMIENTLRFLETRYAHTNVLFMGDFNFYTGLGVGFQLLLNYENPQMRFFDPIGQIGNWHNNPFYSAIHTQATHTSSGGCKVGGGMDDRFDFIMISDEIRFGTKSMRYIMDSYKAFGQDGQRYKGTINGSPQNEVVSQQIADALYMVSDHLPVTMKIYVDKYLGEQERFVQGFYASVFPNPIKDNVQLECSIPKTRMMNLKFYDIAGNLVSAQEHYVDMGQQLIQLETQALKSGFYLLQLSIDNTIRQTVKLIKL